MTDSQTETDATTDPATPDAPDGAASSTKDLVATGTDSDTALASSQGKTSIADTVVSKIAGIATREISGVHALGGGAARAVGALRERIPGSKTNMSQGVEVEVGERQAAIDLGIVAEYGVPIADLAAAIRKNVVGSVEQMTGLEVTEVNITVHDVFLDDGGEPDGDADRAPRVE